LRKCSSVAHEFHAIARDRERDGRWPIAPGKPHLGVHLNRHGLEVLRLHYSEARRRAVGLPTRTCREKEEKLFEVEPRRG